MKMGDQLLGHRRNTRPCGKLSKGTFLLACIEWTASGALNSSIVRKEDLLQLQSLRWDKPLSTRRRRLQRPVRSPLISRRAIRKPGHWIPRQNGGPLLKKPPQTAELIRSI